MKKQQKKLHTDQDGLVSIIITIFLMLLLSLIVLAMAQNSRREQRQALDRQLSAQAFYNAESGINDAVKTFQSASSPGAIVPQQRTRCSTPALSAVTGVGTNAFVDQLDSANRYSCLLWDLTPTTLEESEVPIETSEVLPIQDSTGANITELLIEWQANDKQNSFNFSGCSSLATSFPSKPTFDAQGCDAGVMRVDLVFGSTLTRAALTNNSYVGFFVPQNNNSTGPNITVDSQAIGPSAQGKVVYGFCNNANSPKKCQAKIVSINAPKMYLVMRSFYKENSVTVSGRTATGAVKFANAQAVVDSTGKANDVLKRLRVRVPIESQFIRTPFAIQTGGSGGGSGSGSLCKVFETSPITNTTSRDATECPL